MIISEQQLLEMRCQLEQCITEREGMVAENMQRAHLGNSMAFTQVNFTIIENRIRSIEENIKYLGER